MGKFPLFPNGNADVLATHQSVAFRRLVRVGSFPAGWRDANVTPIPMGPASSSVANYGQISITSVLSKAFEHLLSILFGRFMERCGVHPTSSLLIGKVWVLVMNFCA